MLNPEGFYLREGKHSKTGQVWHKVVGRYLVRVWTGTSSSIPDLVLNIDQYTHVEVEIFEYQKDATYEYSNANITKELRELGIVWQRPSCDKTRGVKEPVENIEKIIKILQVSQNIATETRVQEEKPCWHCKRKNFIGDKTCWHCCNADPTKDV